MQTGLVWGGRRAMVRRTEAETEIKTGVSVADAIADENSRHALDMAQMLSDQLRAAEDRVAELETELTASRERAGRTMAPSHRWRD
jgi:hypothetical protein